MSMYQAQDTFVAEINGSPVLVQKGSVWSSAHPVVKLDADRGMLFRPLDTGDDDVPVAKPAQRAAKAKAAP